MNPALRTAIANAKSSNMPKDRIDRAILQGSNKDSSALEEVRYEGYGPCGVAVIVETATDNRNRTAASVRSVFSKHGGNLGESGSVTFSFNKVGAIYYSIEQLEYDKLLEIAIEHGADNIEENESEYIITCETTNLYELRDSLIPHFGEPNQAMIIWLSCNNVDIDSEAKFNTFCKMINALEDDEDVMAVYHNCPQQIKALSRLNKLTNYRFQLAIYALLSNL